jgi:4-hydroxythreonine-4-phosphate dehydrogenase
MVLDEYTALQDRRPLLLTLGDPAGIGPEVAARVLAGAQRIPRPLVLVGARWALEAGARAAAIRLPDLPRISAPEAARGPVSLLEVDGDVSGFRFGSVSAACGELAVRSVEIAARACLDRTAAGMVTCPIHKEAVHAAGYVHDIGHQEILARLSGAAGTATLLMTPGLRVVHLSTHKSLIEAARYVTRENVLSRLRLTAETLERWGLHDARIAVAALNPHGGEGGLLGREELDEIAPAVADACDRGIRASGPWPADSVFNRAIDGEFDVVLALYHDQGHIAIKVHDFHASTTATLGIPFVRTSVDHGTAFDIAGRGIADPRSLLAAIDAANALIDGRLGAL